MGSRRQHAQLPQEPTTGTGRLRPLRTRLVRGSAAADAPDGAISSVVWELDGAGVVEVGVLPCEHPHGAPVGKRVLWGDGAWPAEMVPANGTLTGNQWFITPWAGASVATVVVHCPDGVIRGSVDQPGLPVAPVSRWTTGMRRDARRLRIRLGGRIWWVRAARLFGVVVVRDDGQPVFGTRGWRFSFAAGTDDLDVSVVLLTLSSVPTSAYSPILGF